MSTPQPSFPHSAAGEWRTRRSGNVAHYYPSDAVASDGKPLCSLSLFYLESVPLDPAADLDGRVAMCEDCRELVEILAS